MKERPILMNGAMVRATLAGSKTQTRRIMKHQPEYPIIIAGDPHTMRYQPEGGEASTLVSLLRHCPHGLVGDQLYVRESTEIDEQTSDSVELSRYSADGEPVLYSGCEDPEFNGAVAVWDYPRRSRPSIHMPRWASRILLEIVSVRIERLQDISDTDIEAEGIDMVALAEAQERYDVIAKDGNASGRPTLRSAWRDLWESTGGDWDANPWLWVISFRRVTP